MARQVLKAVVLGGVILLVFWSTVEYVQNLVAPAPLGAPRPPWWTFGTAALLPLACTLWFWHTQRRGGPTWPRRGWLIVGLCYGLLGLAYFVAFGLGASLFEGSGWFDALEVSVFAESVAPLLTFYATTTFVALALMLPSFFTALWRRIVIPIFLLFAAAYGPLLLTDLLRSLFLLLIGSWSTMFLLKAILDVTATFVRLAPASVVVLIRSSLWYVRRQRTSATSPPFLPAEQDPPTP